ncbi:MAG: flippase-like domain-containing protein [Anaerolineae bacterium]|nr:flippase-like domain-containing protein [Gemmatimonadaceae bacterium]
MDPGTRRRLALGLQLVFVAAVLWYATRSIASQWSSVRTAVSQIDIRWGYLLLSSLLVLLAYALLIGTWRLMLQAWRANLEPMDAVHIWFVSNLGKYVPGKVWQITAMAAMAQQRGVSPIAATGSSLVVNLTNIVSGFLLVLATGASVLRLSSDAGPWIGGAISVAVLAALLALPILLPHLAQLARRVLGREIRVPDIPARAVWLSAVGTALAWIFYGVAFQMLAASLGLSHAGATGGYIAVYTSSYLVGYLTLIAPGGIGVRETMLVAGLSTLGLASEPNAWVLAIVSRLWLTVLEIVPGILFLGRGTIGGQSDSANPNAG